MYKIKNKQIFSVYMIASMFFFNANNVQATYALPFDRSIVWNGNVGISGDIPSRTSICETLDPTGGDDTALIKNAIANCATGQVVKLNEGTFKISSPVAVKSNVTLRGAGIGKTIIKGQPAMSGNYLLGFNSSPSIGTSINITNGLFKGSTQIVTSIAHGWTAGDIILIDQLNNSNDDPPVDNTGSSGTCTWCGRSNGTRSLAQSVKVIAVPNSTTATLEIPLYWNYDISLTPQGSELRGLTFNAGIESLTVDNSLSGSSLQNDYATVFVSGAVSSWVLDTEIIGSYQSALQLNDGAYRNVIRGCRIHEGIPVTEVDGSSSFAPNRGYGISSYQFSSANLIENNTIYHISSGLMTSGPFSGNVFSYNYIANLYLSSINWNAYGISFHGGHAFMNLVEGNIIDSRAASDATWGTKSHNTFFRNKINAAPDRTSAAWAIDLQKDSRYYNMVGNVLGRGYESLYELKATDSSASSIFRLGYEYDSDYVASGNDSLVYNTLLRHSNWDSKNNSVILNSNYDTNLNSSDQVLPNSLYLSSKPAWWGTLAWPAIGSDLNPMAGVIPAKVLNDFNPPVAPSTLWVQ